MYGCMVLLEGGSNELPVAEVVVYPGTQFIKQMVLSIGIFRVVKSIFEAGGQTLVR